MAITADDMVRREVFHCVSALVSMLANGYGELTVGPAAKRQASITELCEQALELCLPVDDYEEAAIQAGWKFDGNYWKLDDETMVCDTAEQVCAVADIEPYQREVFEHWLVSDWLGRKLEAHGERVDFDFQGLTIWARTTTGQDIAQDYVIEQIVDEVNKA